MSSLDIARLRLQNQHIEGTKFNTPLEVVKSLGAIQAQDYTSALWAIGLRMKVSSEKDIEKALAEKKIIRTWPMRGTLHFVAAEDARWMLELLTARRMASYSLRHERMGINTKILGRCRELIIKSLQGGRHLSRPELYSVFEKAGISTANSRGLHILGRLAHDRLICFGTRQDKQQRFVLFDEWIPQSKMVTHEEALARIVTTYFSGHGPATIQDLMWWSGLTAKEVKLGIELAGNVLSENETGGKKYWRASVRVKTKESFDIHLLPPFDEYIVAYRDRDAVLEKKYAGHVNPGANGMLGATIISNGRVVGTWKRIAKKDHVLVVPQPFSRLTSTEKTGVAKAAKRYGEFLGKKVLISS